MKKLLVRSGFLKLSPDGRIANIVFSDGSESQALITKRQAIEIAESMFEIKLTKEELLALKEQIYSSQLVSKSAALEKFCNQMQNDMDELRRKIEAFLKSQADEGEDWKKK